MCASLRLHEFNTKLFEASGLAAIIALVIPRPRGEHPRRGGRPPGEHESIWQSQIEKCAFLIFSS